jgi:hypothetical protein
MWSSCAVADSVGQESVCYRVVTGWEYNMDTYFCQVQSSFADVLQTSGISALE